MFCPREVGDAAGGWLVARYPKLHLRLPGAQARNRAHQKILDNLDKIITAGSDSNSRAPMPNRRIQITQPGPSPASPAGQQTERT